MFCQFNYSPRDQSPNHVQIATMFKTKIFVGSLSKRVKAIDLAELFSFYGQVKEAKVIMDGNNKSKGYGFVTFSTRAAVESVLSAGKIYLKKKEITVSAAIKRGSPVSQLPMVFLPHHVPYSPIPSPTNVSFIPSPTPSLSPIPSPPPYLIPSPPSTSPIPSPPPFTVSPIPSPTYPSHIPNSLPYGHHIQSPPVMYSQAFF